MSGWFIRLTLGLSLLAASVTSGSPQTAERRLYAVSPSLKQDLDAHQFDAQGFEGAVNAIATGLASGDLAPILAQSAPTLRVTEGRTNKVVAKDQLGAFGTKLLKTPHLREDVTNDDQVIVRGDEVGLARGSFWLDQQCLDAACTQKKTVLVTINLP